MNRWAGRVAASEGRGEHRAQITFHAAFGCAAVNGRFGLEGVALPEHFQGADQPECDGIGFDRTTRLALHEAAGQVVHQRFEFGITRTADVVVLLP